jgi:hypothetical protein
MFPSYGDYRPKTHASNIIGLRSHTKGENMHGWKRDREGNLKLKCGCCAHCGGANKVILNWQRPLWVGDQEVVKRSDRDEAMWVAIHKLMIASLGICLHTYLYVKLAKTLSFLLSPMFCRQQNQRRRGQNRFCLEAGLGERWPKQRIHM